MRMSLQALLLGALALVAPCAVVAQSTDGFHATQVIPLVVETDSFRSQLVFTNILSAQLTIRAFYLPAEGTSQAGELDCGTFTLAAGQARTFASLRSLCAGLPPTGSQFGTLHTRIDNPQAMTGYFSYAAFSRVENPSGMGFTVEGFPAHTFTSAWTGVSGLRRLAATATTPAFQTNCFVSSLHQEDPAATATDTVFDYDIADAAGTVIAERQLVVPVGKMVRVLDIFGYSGLPDGDYDGMQLKFYRAGQRTAVPFCTVQDNRAYSADFRIAKQEVGFVEQVAGGTTSSPFAHDEHVLRRTTTAANPFLPGDLQANRFVIPAGHTSNTHLIYVRNPDWIGCDVVAPSGSPVINLEIRLRRGDAVLAGGDNIRYFAPVYLGDKDRAYANTYYVLEVEGNETGTDVDRPYMLRCRSGSGHTAPVIVRTGPDLF